MTGQEHSVAAETPLLSYPTPPGITVGRQDTLRIVAVNETGKDVELKRLTVVLPTGKEGKQLFDGTADSVTVGADTQFWDVVKDNVSSPVAGVRVGIKNSDGVSVKHNQQVTFTVHFQVNTVRQKVPVSLKETSDGKVRTGSLDVNKVPQELTLTGLRSVPSAVSRGTLAQLVWKTTAGELKVDYKLFYTADGKQQEKDVNGKKSYDLYPYQGTSVKLVATVTDAPSVQSVVSCYVTVIEPRVDAVNITIRKGAKLLGAAPTTGLLSGFAPDDLPRSAPVTERFAAETDGFLLATVRPSNNAEVALVLTPDETDGAYLKLETSRRGSLLLPVRRGKTAKVAVTPRVNKTEYLLTLDWRPMGTGALVRL
ncbi:hypothetical protein [Streptomyces chrestomyceticus]|uniref:hypothetical protein n=1 Tax=Streptomyces chrestomyceticus TaxID=68185 RepID=UPI0033C2DA4E